MLEHGADVDAKTHAGETALGRMFIICLFYIAYCFCTVEVQGAVVHRAVGWLVIFLLLVFEPVGGCTTKYGQCDT